MKLAYSNSFLREVDISGYEPMIWALPKLSIGHLIEKFEYLKENYGLTQSRLGYSIGLGESTISRIFRKAHSPNRATLHSIWLGLTLWEDYLDNEEEYLKEMDQVS